MHLRFEESPATSQKMAGISKDVSKGTKTDVKQSEKKDEEETAGKDVGGKTGMSILYTTADAK